MICFVCKTEMLYCGRMINCKHVFCISCANANTKSCPRCKEVVLNIEEKTPDLLFICELSKTCYRSYLSERDLEAHVVYRHRKKRKQKKPPTSKTTSAATMEDAAQGAVCSETKSLKIAASTKNVPATQGDVEKSEAACSVICDNGGGSSVAEEVDKPMVTELVGSDNSPRKPMTRSKKNPSVEKENAITIAKKPPQKKLSSTEDNIFNRMQHLIKEKTLRSPSKSSKSKEFVKDPPVIKSPKGLMDFLQVDKSNVKISNNSSKSNLHSSNTVDVSESCSSKDCGHQEPLNDSDLHGKPSDTLAEKQVPDANLDSSSKQSFVSKSRDISPSQQRSNPEDIVPQGELIGEGRGAHGNQTTYREKEEAKVDLIQPAESIQTVDLHLTGGMLLEDQIPVVHQLEVTTLPLNQSGQDCDERNKVVNEANKDISEVDNDSILGDKDWILENKGGILGDKEINEGRRDVTEGNRDGILGDINENQMDKDSETMTIQGNRDHRDNDLSAELHTVDTDVAEVQVTTTSTSNIIEEEVVGSDQKVVKDQSEEQQPTEESSIPVIQYHITTFPQKVFNRDNEPNPLNRDEPNVNELGHKVDISKESEKNLNEDNDLNIESGSSKTNDVVLNEKDNAETTVQISQSEQPSSNQLKTVGEQDKDNSINSTKQKHKRHKKEKKNNKDDKKSYKDQSSKLTDHEDTSEKKKKKKKDKKHKKSSKRHESSDATLKSENEKTIVLIAGQQNTRPENKIKESEIEKKIENTDNCINSLKSINQVSSLKSDTDNKPNIDQGSKDIAKVVEISNIESNTPISENLTREVQDSLNVSLDNKFIAQNVDNGNKELKQSIGNIAQKSDNENKDQDTVQDENKIVEESHTKDDNGDSKPIKAEHESKSHKSKKGKHKHKSHRRDRKLSTSSTDNKKHSKHRGNTNSGRESGVSEEEGRRSSRRTRSNVNEDSSKRSSHTSRHRSADGASNPRHLSGGEDIDSGERKPSERQTYTKDKRSSNNETSRGGSVSPSRRGHADTRERLAPSRHQNSHQPTREPVFETRPIQVLGQTSSYGSNSAYSGRSAPYRDTPCSPPRSSKCSSTAVGVKSSNSANALNRDSRPSFDLRSKIPRLLDAKTGYTPPSAAASNHPMNQNPGPTQYRNNSDLYTNRDMNNQSIRYQARNDNDMQTYNSNNFYGNQGQQTMPMGDFQNNLKMVQNVTNQFLQNMQAVGQQPANAAGMMFNAGQTTVNPQSFLQFQNQLNQLNPAAQHLQNQLQQQQQQQMLNFTQNQAIPNLMNAINMQGSAGINNNPANLLYNQINANQMPPSSLNNQSQMPSVGAGAEQINHSPGFPSPREKSISHLHADLRASLLGHHLFTKVMTASQLKMLAPEVKKDIRTLKVAIALQEQAIKEERKKKMNAV